MTKQATGDNTEASPLVGGIGARRLRVEDRPLLTGTAQFLDDLPFKGGLEVAFVRSEVAHGRLVDAGVSSARELAGVEAILTAEDLDLGPLLPPNDNPDVAPPAQPVLARDKVRFAGEPIALVLARDRYVAEDARDIAFPEIERSIPRSTRWRPSPTEPSEIHDETPNLAIDFTRDEGDVDDAMAAADVVVERTFQTPRHSGMPIEARAVLARPAGGGVEIFTSSQAPHSVPPRSSARSSVSTRSWYRVATPDIGGGFGVEAHAYPEEVALAAAALRTGRAVKWMRTGPRTWGVAQARSAAPPGLGRDQLAGGPGRHGRGHGLRQGAYGAFPHGVSLEAMTTSGMIPGPYQLSNYRSACALR